MAKVDIFSGFLGAGKTTLIKKLIEEAYGDEKIAALGIVMRVTMVVQLILVGFAFGGVPLFGYLYGAGEKEKLGKLLRFCTIFLCGLALAESVPVFALVL